MPAAILPALITAAGTVLSTVLAPKPKAPTAAAVAAPTRLPGDAERDAAKRNSLLEQQQRKGRASTILTDNTSDSLGG